MTRLFKYPAGYATLLLIILFVTYGVFEALRFAEKPEDSPSIEAEISHSLDNAVLFFDEFSREFLQQSELIRDDVQEALRLKIEKLSLHNHLNNYEMWGITVLKNNEPWIWNGFNLSSLSDSTAIKPDTTKTSIVNYNNVIVCLNQQSFDVNDKHYFLLTAKKLSQTSNLPLAENVTYQLTDEFDLQLNYPVHYNFFGNTPINAVYRTLGTTFSDSVGTVYAIPNQPVKSGTITGNSHSLHRFIFQAAIFLTLFITLTFWSYTQRSIKISISVFLLVISSWPLLLIGGLSKYLVTLIHPASTFDIQSIQHLTGYAVNAILLFFLFVSFHRLIALTQKPEWNDKHFRTIALSLLFGVLQFLLILFFINSTQSLLADSGISLMDLELSPEPLSFFFYIFSGIFFIGMAGMIISTGYHLSLVESGKTIFISVITMFGFICAYFLSDLFLDDFMIVDWIFLLSLLLLLVFLSVIHFIHQYPHVLKQMSGFRMLMIGVFITSTVIYIIIWNSVYNRLDGNLLDQVTEFTAEETVNTDDVLYNLLSDIEQSFDDLTDKDLNERVPNIQNQFHEAIQRSIQPNFGKYSLYIKLITTDDREIANFSTSVVTPIWRSFYSSSIMLPTYRGEQIRWQNNRPVIWDNPPSNLSDRFISLSRGWIPIYDRENHREIIAWIAGDVYLERADYNKPMTALLSENSSDIWKQSYYLAEFTGSRLTRNGMFGLYYHQPQYHKLPEQELDIALRDSLSFLVNRTVHGSFREVLVNLGNRRVVKASTPLPSLNQHLFSYFRLQIVLIFFGLFCFSVLAMIGFKEFSLFGQNRKFKDRLIDGLTLATILFLIVLTFATQYAVGIQNEKNLERELIQNLNNVSESIKQRSAIATTNSADIRLSDFSSPFNVDVILYNKLNVTDSTTPQVFQQNVMPSVIPYPVYEFIYTRQRNHYITTANIGNEELLIGYQSLLDSEGQISAVIAIPTFLESPVYKEQMLETTSYLFVAYLLMFSLFIAGSVFISGQLTKPLSIIQAGLKKISRGDMKTKVPVTSRDEIGSLASAYNNMVERLEHAQQELMKAERESAWKEMAQQVAHEIKNPLTPMKLNLQHLQRQLENNPDKAMELKPVIEKTADNIIGQIESLNKIASDFSKFAQPIREPKESVDITKLVESVSDLYSHDSSVKIHLQVPDQSITIEAVEDEMRRVLVNLIKNAIEACDKEQVIIHLTLEKNSDYLILKIDDNGSGIEQQDADKIFVPNFSTKSSGTGLGLAITKKIVEAHDGEIWFESREKKGTTFFIKLPIS